MYQGKSIINERESENKYQIEMILSNILKILKHSETGMMMMEPELKKQPYQYERERAWRGRSVIINIIVFNNIIIKNVY